MIPSQEDIVAITQNILTMMLRMESNPVEWSDAQGSGKRLTGCIQISGEWKGGVIVQATETFTRAAAGGMLQIPTEDVEDSDLQDALAELTNMIGGSIKSQVASPSFLSLPSVTEGRDFRFHLKGAKVISETSFDCDGERFDVILCESV